MSTPDKIGFIDVSPKQIVSVAAALIPFLEHDDANRALMGSNMQRQAVPTLRDREAAGGYRHRAHRGPSTPACAWWRAAAAWWIPWTLRRIVVRVNDEETMAGEPGVDIYNLTKYTRSNQNTCMNQRPLVKPGDMIATRRHPGGRSVHGHGRAGARPEPAGGLHALERLQLRGLHPHLRARGEGRTLHHHPHRGTHLRRPRHQARVRGDYRRHPQRGRVRTRQAG